MSQTQPTPRSSPASSPTLWSRVTELAAARPDDLAVVDLAGARRHTYADLASHAARVARHLLDVGVGAGDVVSVQLPNRYETVAIALGVFGAGAVINPLLPNYRAKELHHIFTTARSKVVFTPSVYRGHDYPAMMQALAADLPADSVRVVGDDTDAGANLPAAPAGDAGPLGNVDPSAVSELIFSSGTEATPKGIMHTEETTNAGVRSVRHALGVDEGDAVWMPSPVGHSTGFNFGLRFALYQGLPLVLQDRWDASIAIEFVRTHRCSYTLAATTFLQDLVDELTRRGERLAELTRFCCGGAPVPPELVARAAELGVDVLRLYGSTEALVVTVNRPDSPLDRRQHTDGLPVPGAEIRICDDNGVALPPGREGEIEVRSEQAAVGYFEDPERTAATFRSGGWVRSGDLGVIDEEGYLAIVGRKKEIIIRGGLNIAPREIEELLLEFPEVERCAVIGRPDARLGERICACVSLAPGASLAFDVMVDRLRAAGLATYKLPEELREVAELPTTASGKIQKHVLAAEISWESERSERGGWGQR